MLDGAAQAAIAGRHSIPIVGAWSGLTQVEGYLARDSLPHPFRAGGIAVPT